MHVEQALWNQRFQTGSAPSYREYEVHLSNSSLPTDSLETSETILMILFYVIGSSQVI